LRQSGLLAGADAIALESLAKAATLITVETGQLLIEEGTRGSEAWLLIEGELLVFTRLRHDEVALARLNESGCWVGDQALAENPPPRNASVRALGPSVLLRIERNDVRRLLPDQAGLDLKVRELGRFQAEARLNVESLILAALTSDGAAIADLDTRTFDDGEAVFRQGEVGSELFVIKRGVASVQRCESDGLPRIVARMLQGQSFGERALLGDGKRSATVLAEGPLELLVIDRERFLDLHEKASQVRDYFTSLERVYALSSIGVVTQYAGHFLERPAINLLIRKPDGAALIASRLTDEPVFSIRAERYDRSRVRTVRWTDPGRGAQRELEVVDDRLIAAFVSGPWQEIDRIHQLVIDRAPWTVLDDEHFSRSGNLPPTLLVPAADVLCKCMRVTESAICEAIAGGANRLSLVQDRTGAGAMCGGCIPRLERLVGAQATYQPAVLVETADHSVDVRSFRFAVERGSQELALPGQHVVVRAVLDGVPVERAYTLTSSVAEARWREITVRRDPLGTFSNHLFNLKQGAQVELSQPKGQVHFAPTDRRRLVCLVAGIGVTPALNVVRSFAALGASRPVHVLHCASTREGLTGHDELQRLAQDSPWLSVTGHITREQGSLTSQHITALGRGSDAQFLVCGPSGFQRMVVDALTKSGVPLARVMAETFGQVGAAATKHNSLPSVLAAGLAVLFFAMTLTGLQIAPLSGLHASWTGALLSGLALLALLLAQGRLSSLRLMQRWFEAARHREVHRWLGVGVPLLMAAHTSTLGHGHSQVLTIVMLLIVVTALPLQAQKPDATPGGWRNAVLGAHIALSIGLIGLILTHIWVVLSY
jgi:ferredoxin-NADP reductase/CRP-like cAMP-binding protein